MSFLHGCTTRGDPELAVDGFDLGSYGAWGDVEALCHLPGGELSDEEVKYIELALCELPIERSVSPLDSAMFALLSTASFRTQMKSTGF